MTHRDLDAPAEAPAPGGPVTASVLLLSALTIAANATISPSLPAIRERFADVEGIETLAGLLLTLPSLAIVLSAGLMGWLADTVDRQRLLLAVGALYALGGTSGLWADSLAALLAGRAVLGLGVAGTMILATAWAADLWQGPARERFLGRQGAAMSAGGIVVVVLGGALATLGWRGAFAAYALAVPVTLLALWALAPFARARSAGASRRAPGPGAEASRMPWRAFAFVGPLGFLFMTTFYVMPTRGPFLLAEIGVTSPLAVGLMISTMMVASLPGSLLYGRLRRRASMMAVFAGSWAVMGTGMLIVGLAPSALAAVAGLAVMGLGMGPSLPNYTTFWMASVPPTLRGRASGMLTTAFFAGQFASPLVTAPLAAGLGLGSAFAVLGLAQIALAAGLAGLALREGRALALAPVGRAP